RQARDYRSQPAKRRQGHAGGSRRRRGQRRRAQGRSRIAGKNGRPDGGHAAAAGVQAALLMEPLGSLDELTQALRCLPGVGPKAAQRMALHLLQHDREGAQRLGRALEEASRSVRHCERCNTFTEGEMCALCRSAKLDASLLCVVETPADLLMIEPTQESSRLYFVLMGRLSPLDGVCTRAIVL